MAMVKPIAKPGLIVTDIIKGIVNGARDTNAVAEFAVLDSDGNSFSVPLNVLDSDGNSFTVSTSVLDSDGNAFTVI